MSLMNNAKTAPLDNFDRKILEIVQQSNRETSDRIAEQIGLSPAAVQRRMKRMREQNVIQADVSVVNPQAVGLGVTIVVEVTLERERSDLLDSFKKEMISNPAVQQCFYVTGSADFILIVTAVDMDDYESFTRDVFFENHNVRNFQSNVVMNHVKKGLTVPVNLED
ncbi:MULTISPECIES: Lrp/AsnC family transcriptional regulator [Colwellia]|uniref:Transcriptional regulator, AsnC family n=1 Tax=Colwellia psychrerythraea (strain 34H / ATCC BAA-681) TaxID=167879 RepID=Q47UG5_COLP3|nr:MULTISPECIES: Lrp/AsnC family transcriptional regulator [Colwellia]AAZ25541.1 transcriptional regulator, AsnC family [Colwellia psychrerythraea 34H]